jgi:hypothetical protein
MAVPVKQRAEKEAVGRLFRVICIKLTVSLTTESHVFKGFYCSQT